jgi:transcriptional regulator with XRE-family HTH domain
MDILDAVQAEIVASGKSQSEIAREADLPQPTVNRLVNGKVKHPGSATVEKLSRALPGLPARIAENLGRAS